MKLITIPACSFTYQGHHFLLLLLLLVRPDRAISRSQMGTSIVSNEINTQNVSIHRALEWKESDISQSDRGKKGARWAGFFLESGQEKNSIRWLHFKMQNKELCNQLRDFSSVSSAVSVTSSRLNSQLHESAKVRCQSGALQTTAHPEMKSRNKLPEWLEVPEMNILLRLEDR